MIARTIVLASLLVATSVAAAPVGAVAVIDKPVATVDNDVVWQSQVDERIASSPSAAGDRARLIAEMIDELLLLRGADELRIETDSKDVDLAFEEIKKQNGLDDAQLDAELKKIPMTRAAYKVDLARQIRLIRFSNQAFRPRITVTEAEVDAKIKELGIPPKDADRGGVRSSLMEPKLRAVRDAWLVEKRKAARIVVAK